MKNIKDISNLLNINNQKKKFDSTVDNVVNIIKNKFNIELERKEVFIKNDNIIKIKTSSNKRFLLFLRKNELKQEDFTIEL